MGVANSLDSCALSVQMPHTHKRPQAHTKLQLDHLSADVLKTIWESFTDVCIVNIMSICKRFAVTGACALRDRHDLEAAQLSAFVNILRGKNVFMTGGPGTGKSFVTRLAMKALRQDDLHVAIAAPTALAAANVHGVTIDRLLGFRPLTGLKKYPQRVLHRKRRERGTGIYTTCDPRDDLYEGDAADDAEDIVLSNAPEHDESEEDEADYHDDTLCFVAIDNKWIEGKLKTLRVLFVDEVSMIFGGKLRLMVETLKRYGVYAQLQIVFVGDFAQLPPVLKEGTLEHKAVYSDKQCAQYCFREDAWSELAFQEFNLDVNRRCAHLEWNNVLNELRLGTDVFQSRSLKERLLRLTAGDITFDQIIERRLPGIYVRNETGKKHSDALYKALPGKESVFPAEDNVVVNAPKKLPRYLRLKPGMRVMATETVCDENNNTIMYNGRTATVCSTADGHVQMAGMAGDDHYERICVRFDSGRRAEIRRYKLTRVSYESSVRFERWRCQFPLKSASTYTVDKSQGQSIATEHVFDAKGTRWKRSGLFFVAVSRTTNPRLLHINSLNDAHSYIDANVLSFHKSLRSKRLPFFAVKPDGEKA